MLVYLIGYFVLFSLLARFVVWVIGLARKIDLDVYKHRDGAWALITGATDGIGLGFAQVILHVSNNCFRNYWHMVSM